MLNLLKRFTPPVKDCKIELYEHEGSIFRFKAVVALENAGKLRIKEYRFADGSRKYSYQWEDGEGGLQIRWDNVSYWPDIPTFPHHKHVKNEKDVRASTETDLEAVLRYIVECGP